MIPAGSLFTYAESAAVDTTAPEGLEPEQLRAVFDRFYRADRSRSRDSGGTGLGLAIARALVAMHGGTLAATSAGRGQGSTSPYGCRSPALPSAAPATTQAP